MKYLLTQDELETLTDKNKAENEINKRDKALEWCRQQLQIERCGKTYCDFCPVSSIGSNYIDGNYIRKEAGKGNTPTYEISKLICTKDRSYSK